MSGRNKKYIPNKRYNPAHIAANNEILQQKLKRKIDIMEMQFVGVQNHFSKITNFTSHDVKNAIQNMDAIISTMDVNNVSMEKIAAIKNCLNSMRESLDDFYRLSYDGRKVDFTLSELANLVEMLNKASLNEFKIKLQSIVQEPSVTINQKFHNILQVMNNLLINSITAFADKEGEKDIRITYSIFDSYVCIEIEDNAHMIPEEIRDKIFEMHFSTTGGSGIGLAHTKYILECLNGSINLECSLTHYCTKFAVKFPLVDHG